MNNVIKFDVVFQIGEKSWRREVVKKIVFDDAGVFEIGIDTGNLDFRNEKYTLFQFAQCFDKNGKPVYQGHLLKNEQGVMFEVIQACGSCFIVKDEQAVILEDKVTKELEIVGDIVQNLDLVLSEEEFNKKIKK